MLLPFYFYFSPSCLLPPFFFFKFTFIQWANFINERSGRADSLWCIYFRYEGQTTIVLIKRCGRLGPTSGLSFPPSDSLLSKRGGKLNWSKAALSLSENDGRWKACPPLQKYSWARVSQQQVPSSEVQAVVWYGLAGIAGAGYASLIKQNRNAWSNRKSNVFLLDVKEWVTPKYKVHDIISTLANMKMKKM